MIWAAMGALLVGLSLGLLGSGGSILTVPVLVYILGHEDKTAIAESLAIVGAIAFIGALPYAKEKLVEWRVALLFGVPGMAGTYAGAWAAGFVSGRVQLLAFAGVMLLAALLMWRKAAGAKPGPESSEPKKPPVARLVVEGLVVGALTGFVGVGGGFLIVPALVLLAGLPMRRAVATSLTIIAMKSAVGFVKYLDVLDEQGLSVDWTAVGIFVLLGALGSFAGKAVNARVNQRALRKVFAVFLVVMAVFIIAKETGVIGDDGPGAAEQSVVS